MRSYTLHFYLLLPSCPDPPFSYHSSATTTFFQFFKNVIFFCHKVLVPAGSHTLLSPLPPPHTHSSLKIIISLAKSLIFPYRMSPPFIAPHRAIFFWMAHILTWNQLLMYVFVHCLSPLHYKVHYACKVFVCLAHNYIPSNQRDPSLEQSSTEYLTMKGPFVVLFVLGCLPLVWLI